MTDLKKIPEETKLLQDELRELTTTNQKLNGEIETVRYKLKTEIDTLTYKLDKLAYDTEEIRREVRDINRTIDHLRREVIDELRKNKTSSISDIISNLFPLFAITLPSMFVVFMIFLYKMTR